MGTMSKTRVSIPFSQRGPIPIHLEDSYSGSPTGCAVIDVIFPQVFILHLTVSKVEKL